MLEQPDPENYFATVRPDASEMLRPPGPGRQSRQHRVIVQPLTLERDPLLPTLVETESVGKRALFLLIATVIVIAFLAMSLCYWTPAHPGVDQNGYLVGGRMLANHQWAGATPKEPYAFVGPMWIGIRLDTPTPAYFPKYPIGLPSLYALCLKAGPLWEKYQPHIIDQPFLKSTALWMGQANGTTLAYLLSPVCMMASLWAMFLMGRLVGGSFGGIMAMILLATSQVTLAETDNPNSHAAALCFVTWGMYFVARWWQTDRLWRGLIAGLLLGVAGTIRYSEGLLILPLLIAALALPWRRSWLALLFWAVPVTALLAFNLHFIGHVTGYDPTHESLAFRWSDFLNKWEIVAQQLYDHSIFFIPAIAVVGLIALFGQSKRWGFLLIAWLVPGIVLYTAYYWGGDALGAGFLRLFLSLFPPLILAAVWLTVTRLSSAIAAGVIVAIAASIGLRIALPQMERQQASNLNLAYTIDQIVAKVPANGAMVIADDQSNFRFLDNALQFSGDFDLYSAGAFQPPPPDVPNTGQPSPVQFARREAQKNLFDGMSDADRVAEAHRVMRATLDQSKPVLLILPPAAAAKFRSTYMTDGFTAQFIDRWTEPAIVPPEPDADPLAPAAHGYVFNWIRQPQSFECWRITRTASMN